MRCKTLMLVFICSGLSTVSRCQDKNAAEDEKIFSKQISALKEYQAEAKKVDSFNEDGYTAKLTVHFNYYDLDSMKNFILADIVETVNIGLARNSPFGSPSHTSLMYSVKFDRKKKTIVSLVKKEDGVQHFSPSKSK